MKMRDRRSKPRLGSLVPLEAALQVVVEGLNVPGAQSCRVWLREFGELVRKRSPDCLRDLVLNFSRTSLDVRSNLFSTLKAAFVGNIYQLDGYPEPCFSLSNAALDNLAYAEKAADFTYVLALPLKLEC